MPVLDPNTFRARLAAVFGAEIDAIPDDLDGLWDIIGPKLADHTRTKITLTTDFGRFGIPVSDDAGPLSLYQMVGSVVTRWRSAADDSADLAEIRSRLVSAGYVPAKGEALGDVVARAIAEATAADAAREEAEVANLVLEREYDRVRTLAAALANHLTEVTGTLASTLDTRTTR